MSSFKKAVVAIVAGITITLCGVSVVRKSDEEAFEKADPLAEWELECFGYATLTSPDANSGVNLVYEYLSDPKGHQKCFRIRDPISPSINTYYTYVPEVGQEFFRTAFTHVFADSDTLICSFWEWGAVGGCQLIVFGYDRDGQLGIVFRRVNRLGFALVDMTGDYNPDVCAFAEGESPIAEVYSWTLFGFRMTDKLKWLPDCLRDVDRLCGE